MTLRMTIHHKITWLLGFSIISLAVASRLIYVSERNIEKTNSSIGQAYEAMSLIQQIVTSVTGFASEPELSSELDSLQQLTRENKDQFRHIASLRSWLLNPSPENRQAAKLLLSSMIKEERGLLAEQKEMNKTIDRRVAYGLVIARFAGFLFVFIILVQLNKSNSWLT
jgi:hypothetical protein